MGYRELAQKMASAAMRIAGDVPITMTYVSVGQGTYNPATDTTSSVDTQVVLKGVLSRPKEDEDDNNEANTLDTKVIIARRDMGVITAKDNDYLLFGGLHWEIVKYVSDPADATYIFTVRAP